MTLRGVSFDSNRASNFGGALRAQGSFLCTSCSFTANRAGLGGAVGFARYTWAGFKDYTFMRNSAIRVGGARPRCWGVLGFGGRGPVTAPMCCTAWPPNALAPSCHC